jgi:hypothetical protein
VDGGDMSEILINVDPKQINKFVAEAILESCLGEEVRKAIEKVVGQISQVDYRGHGVISDIVKAKVQETICELLNTEYREQIKTLVSEAMTEKAIKELTDAALNALINKAY